MIRVEGYAPTAIVPGEQQVLVVELPYDMRKKSRLRATTRCGREVGIFLPRGNVMADGDMLLGNGQQLVRIEAADEPLSVVTADDPLLLLRAAYHLGNRHVSLQITADSLSFQHDHVLDDMVRGLGLRVTYADAKFQPESGAYAAGHSSADHSPADHPGAGRSAIEQGVHDHETGSHQHRHGHHHHD